MALDGSFIETAGLVESADEPVLRNPSVQLILWNFHRKISELRANHHGETGCEITRTIQYSLPVSQEKMERIRWFIICDFGFHRLYKP